MSHSPRIYSVCRRIALHDGRDAFVTHGRAYWFTDGTNTVEFEAPLQTSLTALAEHLWQASKWPVGTDVECRTEVGLFYIILGAET